MEKNAKAVPEWGGHKAIVFQGFVGCMVAAQQGASGYGKYGSHVPGKSFPGAQSNKTRYKQCSRQKQVRDEKLTETRYNGVRKVEIPMKVSGPGQVQGPSKTKKSDKSGKTDGSFGDMVSSGSQEAAGTKTTQSIAHVDALLAVQESEDPTQRAAKRRMRERADDILNELDKIRMAMLNGQLTVGHMIDVADVVAAHREKIPDPKLTAIMDEIDLRAQVELAKMRVVLDKQAGAA